MCSGNEFLFNILVYFPTYLAKVQQYLPSYLGSEWIYLHILPPFCRKEGKGNSYENKILFLNPIDSEWPKLHRILAFPSAIVKITTTENGGKNKIVELLPLKVYPFVSKNIPFMDISKHCSSNLGLKSDLEN